MEDLTFDEMEDRNAYETWKANRDAAYEPLDEKQRQIVDSARNVFRHAQDAYWAANDKYADAKHRTDYAESFASACLKCLKYFNELAGTNDFTVADKLQKINDYLKKHNLLGLPEYENLEKQEVYVTAHGMINDMHSFVGNARSGAVQMY